MTIKELAAKDETLAEYVKRKGLIFTEALHPLGGVSSYNVMACAKCPFIERRKNE